MSTESERPSNLQIDASEKNNDRVRRYWRVNIGVVLTLLMVWAFVGYGCGVFWIEPLNDIPLGQVGLGFWIAQQGSIFVFVLLVAIYAWLMDRFDQRLGRSR